MPSTDAEIALAVRSTSRIAYPWAYVAYYVGRRPFLAGEDGPWVHRKRAQLARALPAGASTAPSSCAAANGELAEAVQAAEDALALEPLRETTYQRLMRVHADAGQPGRGAAASTSAAAPVLDEELGVPPSPETRGGLRGDPRGPDRQSAGRQPRANRRRARSLRRGRRRRAGARSEATCEPTRTPIRRGGSTGATCRWSSRPSPPGSTPRPLLRGLPGDACPCPHWGYVFTGSFVIRYADHEETVPRPATPSTWRPATSRSLRSRTPTCSR